MLRTAYLRMIHLYTICLFHFRPFCQRFTCKNCAELFSITRFNKHFILSFILLTFDFAHSADINMHRVIVVSAFQPCKTNFLSLPFPCPMPLVSLPLVFGDSKYSYATQPLYVAVYHGSKYPFS